MKRGEGAVDVMSTLLLLLMGGGGGANNAQCSLWTTPYHVGMYENINTWLVQITS